MNRKLMFYFDCINIGHRRSISYFELTLEHHSFHEVTKNQAEKIIFKILQFCNECIWNTAFNAIINKDIYRAF